MADTGRGEHLLSWSIYLSHAPPKWLGTVEAATAQEAIRIAAKKFGEEPEPLFALRMD
jgi:hypothetical protein